jgi:hypothetical protein
MLIWNAEQEKEDILIELNEAITHDCVSVRIFVENLPAFIDNRVSLVVFKKQLQNYPKSIEFFSKNLQIVRLLKETGYNASLPNYSSDISNPNPQFKHQEDEPLVEISKKSVLPSIDSFNFKEEPIVIKEEPTVGIELKSMIHDIRDDHDPLVGFSSVMDQIAELEENDPFAEPQEEVQSFLKVRDVAIKMGKPKEEKTIIKKINFDEYFSKDNSIDFVNNVTEGDFSKMSSILDKVVEDDFDEMLINLDKIKLNISESTPPYFMKRPMKTLVASGFCCFIIFGFTGYLNYIPSFAYRINVKNNSQIKQELIKLNPSILREKQLNLSIYSEQQVPKQKKEFFERAKGSVVLFSTGANSCTLTNGGFLVNANEKYYRVLQNYLYSDSVNIKSYSQSNPTLTFEVEALDKGGEMNIPKDTVLNLSTIYKENLSKNCYAKTTTGVNDFTIKDNNVVTADIVKSLQDYSTKAIADKVKEEIDELSKQNIYTQQDWVESDSAKNLFNSEVGEVRDLVTLNRVETKKLKYLPLDVVENQIKTNISGDNRDVKNVKINSLAMDGTLFKAEVTYDLVDKNNVDKNKIKDIIYKSGTDQEITDAIKKEYPNVDKVQKLNEGMNVPVFKKINVDIIDLN